jgi:hypothetical protein
MAAKAVIRDVGRVLGHPYGFVDRISKLVPPDPGMTLAKAFEAEPQLPEIYDADEEVKALIDMARKLEGVTRNAGKHAGGVVIAPTKITDFAPLYCDETGSHPVTQFDKNDVEYAGLVKFDFLGLRTLTIIDWALKMINPRRAKQGLEPIDIAAIPLDDKKSFDMLQRSETTAVFQLESRGMKDLIKRLQPDCFEDMIALVALFRPGPLQSGMVDNFIDRKHGREELSYPDVQWQHESLHRMATAGAQIPIKQLRCDPVLDRLEQRVAQMVLLMAFDPHKVRFEDCQPKRPAANQRQFGVGQPAAIACKAVCQPVIGLMKHKGQTLRMSDLNARYAVKQLTQRGQGEQHGQAALKLRSLDFIPVVPVQRRADIKAPAQAIRRDLPVVRQIAHRLAAVVVESGNAGEDLPHQMLLGAPR